MINLITGPPRAGKTYLTVYWLFKNYLKFDDEKLTYTMKDKALLITNIEGLRLPHKQLDDVLNENGYEPEDFFIKEVQEELSKEYPTIIYVIDEAHGYLPSELSSQKEKSKLLKDYFAYHGHYNQHFWLITQDCSLIFQPLVKFAECEYETLRASLRPPGLFKYNRRVPGKIKRFGSLTIKKLTSVCDLYVTADNQETEKAKRTNAYLYLTITVTLIIILVPTFIYKFKNMGKVKAAETKQIIVESNEKEEEVKKEVKIKQVRIRKTREELLEDGYKWTKLTYSYDPVKKKIKVYDFTFGLVDLKDYEYDFKVVNGDIYGLLPIQKDSDGTAVETESFESGSEL